MSEQQLPAKKSAPRPSKAEQSKAKHFEFELLDTAIAAYKDKDYLKAAMMSWSFIEEFLLPTYIEFTAKRQKIGFNKRIIENSSVVHLIRYYYLVTYDEELYMLLEEARKRRNSFIHGAYKSAR